MTRLPDLSSSPMQFHIHESIDRVRARIDAVLQAPLDAPVVTSAALELPRIFGERSGDEYHLRTVGDTRSTILSVGILTLASTSDGTELRLRFRDGAWASVPRALLAPIILLGSSTLGDTQWAFLWQGAAAFSVVVGAIPLVIVSLRDRRMIRLALSLIFPEARIGA